MTRSSNIHVLLLPTLITAPALCSDSGTAGDASENTSPVRVAFIANDISLEQVVKETRKRKQAEHLASQDEFSATQPGPGRAARERMHDGSLGPDLEGLFAPMPLKVCNEHDQVTIVVLESSRVDRSQDLETEKDWGLAFEAAAWTDFFNAGNLFTANGGDNLPRFEFVGAKDFDGEGDYDSLEEITFRTTATVVEVLPNGNLVLEARHTTKTDSETTVKTITGTIDPRHIAADDTILHWRLYDLDLNIQNTGFVKDAANKGFIAQVLDFIFAF